MSFSNIEQHLLRSSEALASGVPGLEQAIGSVAAARERLASQVSDSESSPTLNHLNEAHVVLTSMFGDVSHYQDRLRGYVQDKDTSPPTTPPPESSPDSAGERATVTPNSSYASEKYGRKNASEAFNTLTEPQLKRLEYTLTPPWGDVIRHHLAQRNDDLRQIWDSPGGQPKCPEYLEAAGPQSYLSRLREYNNDRPLQDFEFNRFPREKDTIRQLSRRYAKESDPADLELFDHEYHAVDFAEANLRHLLLTPRIAALRQYEKMRDTTIRQSLPTMTVQGKHSVAFNSDRQRITGDQLSKASEEIKQILYAGPLPDFFQLSPEQQDASIAQIFDELRQMTRIIAKHDPDLLKYYDSYKAVGPLAFISAKKLQTTIAQSSALPAEICRLALKRPTDFRKHPWPKRPGGDPAPKSTAASKEPVAAKQYHSDNERAVDILLDDADINPDVLDLRPGSTVAITAPDQVISTASFDRIIDKHLQLIGRAMAEGIENPSPQGVLMHHWDSFNVGKLLRG